MSIKQIIKEFEENKIDILYKAQRIISVGQPSLMCDVEDIVRDNDKRMSLVSWFLYYYGLIESNIKNYKEYSKPSNFDKETLEMIEENLIVNKQQYDNAVESIRNWRDK